MGLTSKEERVHTGRLGLGRSLWVKQAVPLAFPRLGFKSLSSCESLGLGKARRRMRAQGGGAFGVDSLPSAFDTPSYPEGAGLRERAGVGGRESRERAQPGKGAPGSRGGEG